MECGGDVFIKIAVPGFVQGLCPGLCPALIPDPMSVLVPFTMAV